MTKHGSHAQAPAPPASPQLTANPDTVLLSGICSRYDDYNGVYTLQGTTANGAPHYRHTNGGRSIYYDLDCSNNGHAARWIIDQGFPDPTLSSDLDGDGACRYIGRLSSTSLTPPLGTNAWRVNCGGWADHDLTLQIYTRPPSLPPAPPASPPFFYPRLVVTGFCTRLAALDSTFILQGTTASGAPYYASSNGFQSLAYDLDCNGDGSISTGMWIFDTGLPDASRSADLDGDNGCAVLAVLQGSDPQVPLGTRAWEANCGSGFTRVDVMLEGLMNPPLPPRSPPLPPVAPPSAPSSPPVLYYPLVLSGLCPEVAILNGPYLPQGIVANGAPYYVHADAIRDDSPNNRGAGRKSQTK